MFAAVRRIMCTHCIVLGVRPFGTPTCVQSHTQCCVGVMGLLLMHSRHRRHSAGAAPTPIPVAPTPIAGRPLRPRQQPRVPLNTTTAPQRDAAISTAAANVTNAVAATAVMHSTISQVVVSLDTIQRWAVRIAYSYLHLHHHPAPVHTASHPSMSPRML